tara:strand:+ start:57 stop:443 length:387 start_codon:yes stop_codon:yes gene_type:complete
MKKVIVFIFSVLLLVSCESNVDKVVRKTAEELNKSCPMFVDKITRLDKVEIDEDGYFHYTYTFPTLTINDINASNFKDEQFKILNKMYNTNEKFDIYRQNNIYLKYTYFDKNNQEIVTLTINDLYEYR